MTLEELRARLANYREAEEKILKGQEYVIGDGVAQRRLRRPDLAEVRAEIRSIDQQIQSLERAASGRRRVMYARPG